MRVRVQQFFLAVFALEMVIKMTAMGIVMRPGSYLRDSVGECVTCGMGALWYGGAARCVRCVDGGCDGAAREIAALPPPRLGCTTSHDTKNVHGCGSGAGGCGRGK